MATLVDGYCLACGDSQLNADSGRCQRCGKVAVKTATQATADRERYRGALGSAVPAPSASLPVTDGSAPLPAAGATAPATGPTLVLPAGGGSRRWLAQTEALLRQLELDLDRARAATKAATQREADLQQSVRALKGLVQGVSVPDAPKAAAASPTGARMGRPPSGRWSRDHDACVVCGTSELKHASRGRCRTCDALARHARPNPREGAKK